VVKREDVLINVWGKDDFFLGRSMDVFISKLRKYLKGEPEIVIETIHGIGFRLTVPGGV
jgi:two-component system, OmpR family, response regulator VicR